MVCFLVPCRTVALRDFGALVSIVNACRITRDVPFTLTHPLADQITTAHTEESAVGLGGNGFGKVRFTSSGGSVEQDTLPRLTLAGKQVRKLDGQDDGLF